MRAPVVCRTERQLLHAVKHLAADPTNIVVVSSGATTACLAAAFPNSNIWLAAENGAFLRPPNALWGEFNIDESSSEWLCLYESLNLSWVKSVEQVRSTVAVMAHIQW
jgi:trehalose-6-phosphatase